MADNQDSEVDVIVGFILGALVGVFVGFVYAPRLGAETRKLLREKAGVAIEKMLEAGEKAKEAAAEA